MPVTKDSSLEVEVKLDEEQHLKVAKDQGLQLSKPCKRPRMAIIYYSTYGHNAAMAEAVSRGVEQAGGEATILQAAETLPDEVLEKMGALGLKNKYHPVITRDMIGTLADDYDGFIFGIPTRFGMMAAQMKSFFDSTGGLWGKGALIGKPAAVWCSTGTQGGGLETTIMTTVTQLVHHGMLFVPLGYSKGDIQFDMAEIHGGSPWGAHTFAGADGSRKPSEMEVVLAEHQGSHTTKIVAKLCQPAAAA